MSKYTKKGFTAVRARDTKTGRPFMLAVPTHGAIVGIMQSRLRKAEKQRRLANRAAKATLREIKCKVPLDQRARTKWSDDVVRAYGEAD